MTREGQSNWSLLTGEPDATATAKGREGAGAGCEGRFSRVKIAG